MTTVEQERKEFEDTPKAERPALEAVGVRPVPRPRDRATATGRAAAVSTHLGRHGVRTRGDQPAREGVWVFAYLPHTARVEIVVFNARTRAAVIERVREVLLAGDYQVSRVDYTAKVVLYASRDAPDTRRKRDKAKGA